jgi:hypothetical protein
MPDGDLVSCSAQHGPPQSFIGQEINGTSTAVALDSWARLAGTGAGQRCHQYESVVQGNHLPPHAELFALRCDDE